MLIAAISPFPGGNRSSSPRLVSPPLVAGVDVVELSG